jgi:hypothetical protein
MIGTNICKEYKPSIFRTDDLYTKYGDTRFLWNVGTCLQNLIYIVKSENTASELVSDSKIKTDYWFHLCMFMVST